MYVEQIMSCEPDTVTPQTKLSHAAQLMRERGRRFLPVVEDDGRLVGLFSHKELAESEPSRLTTLSVGEVNYLTSKLTVEKLMQPEPLTCGPRTLVEEAGRIIRENRVGCLPVVENGRLVGVVTEDDILDFLLDITGCNLTDTARVAIHLPDQIGALGKLLNDINQMGGYIATVVSPIKRDASGRRVAIVRYRAPDPARVDDELRARGYDMITEQLPEEPAPPPTVTEITGPEAIGRWMERNDRFARKLGIVLEEAGAGYARVALEVTADMQNAVSITQGGVAFTLADFAFAVASNSHGTTAVGLSAQINYVAPSRTGERLIAEAKEEARTNRTGFYRVDVRTAEGTLVALFHGTVFRRSDSLKEWMEKKG